MQPAAEVQEVPCLTALLRLQNGSHEVRIATQLSQLRVFEPSTPAIFGFYPVASFKNEAPKGFERN